MAERKRTKAEQLVEARGAEAHSWEELAACARYVEQAGATRSLPGGMGSNRVDAPTGGGCCRAARGGPAAGAAREATDMSENEDPRCYAVTCPHCGRIATFLSHDYPAWLNRIYGATEWAARVAQWEAQGYVIQRVTAEEAREVFHG